MINQVGFFVYFFCVKRFLRQGIHLFRLKKFRNLPIGKIWVCEKLKLHRIEAGCAVGNIASIKVLEKAGMIREGRLRQVLPLKSGWSDNFQYSILETDKSLR